MKKLTILQLYPQDMNIYGDSGNALTLRRRIEWRGLTVDIIDYNQGDDFNELAKKADIIVGGGGQDAGQAAIQADLLSIGERIKDLAEGGAPMLVICGLYQLFGRSFIRQDGVQLDGIGLFDVHTIAKPTRLTGNTTLESKEFGEIIGYENHSGQTFLGENTQPLGRVISGAGNNDSDGHEGVRYKNIIGSYLHGSLLPKNPKIADFLIETAFVKKYPHEDLPEIHAPHNLQAITEKARLIAMSRPR